MVAVRVWKLRPASANCATASSISSTSPGTCAPAGLLRSQGRAKCRRGRHRVRVPRRPRKHNLDLERAEPGRLAYRRSGSCVARDPHKGVGPGGVVGHSICRPVNCPQVRQVAVYRANLAQAGPQVACDMARFRSHDWFPQTAFSSSRRIRRSNSWRRNALVQRMVFAVVSSRNQYATDGPCASCRARR